MAGKCRGQDDSGESSRRTAYFSSEAVGMSRRSSFFLPQLDAAEAQSVNRIRKLEGGVGALVPKRARWRPALLAL
jgi:hypothetical protein